MAWFLIVGRAMCLPAAVYAGRPYELKVAVSCERLHPEVRFRQDRAFRVIFAVLRLRCVLLLPVVGAHAERDDLVVTGEAGGACLYDGKGVRKHVHVRPASDVVRDFVRAEARPMAWFFRKAVIELVLIFGARYVSLRATDEAVPSVC